MTILVGTDNNTYSFESGILTVTGSGSTSALYQGVVRGADSATMDVSSATKIVYGEGITTISRMQFYNQAGSIQEISFPSTLVTIDEYCFYPPINLSSLRIPANVTTIGKQAFVYGGISELIFEGQPTTIGEQAFQNTDAPMTVYSTGWANSTTFPSSITGSVTVTFVTGVPEAYKKATYKGSKLQVDSAIRDGNGAKIDTTYLKSATAASTYATKVELGNYVENVAAQSNSLAIGPSTTEVGNPNSHAVAVGESCSANSDYSIAIGQNAYISQYSQGAIAIGLYAQIASPSKGYAIQLGRGTNSEAGTLYVGLGQTSNYKLLGNDGKIPDARLDMSTVFVTQTITNATSGTVSIASGTPWMAQLVDSNGKVVTAEITIGADSVSFSTNTAISGELRVMVKP